MYALQTKHANHLKPPKRIALGERRPSTVHVSYTPNPNPFKTPQQPAGDEDAVVVKGFEAEWEAGVEAARRDSRENEGWCGGRCVVM